jgi:histidinol phosphatase-like PHP family hydrolase
VSGSATLDFNIHVSALLSDIAQTQSSIYGRRAYERAARAVALLPRPIPELTPAELASSPAIGKSASRVIREAVASRDAVSTTHAKAVQGRAADLARRRALQEGFMSLAVARQVLEQPAPAAVSRQDYRGDFQMHSLWSDGAQSIAEMALGCSERGYTHFAVTDHSAGLKIARGLSAEAMQAQHREIDALNDALEGRMTVLKGIEANIQADGSLDVPHGQLRRCDIVLAAPHSRLDEPDDQTGRLIEAVRTPGVHVLAHPSGRKFGRRPGLNVRWDRVFKEAVAHNVAIELDGDPSRQDLGYGHVSHALQAGCTFAIDSDAHSSDELVFSDISLAHARLAGVPAARVINCWTTKKLRAWLRDR